MNATQIAESHLADSFGELRNWLKHMPFAAIEQLRDMFTEQLLLAQDAAQGRGVIGIVADDDTPDMASEFLHDQSELSVDDGPLSISTLEAWIGDELFVHDNEPYAAVLRRRAKTNDKAGWICGKILSEVDPQRLIAGQEMDLLHGGDWAEWASSQFQPTRVDEDYVAEAPLILIDESEEDPLESERAMELRGLIELCHSAIAERRAELRGFASPDEWAAFDYSPQEFTWSEQLMAGPHRPPSPAVGYYAGTTYVRPAPADRDPDAKIRRRADERLVDLDPPDREYDLGVLHEIPEEWYHALNRRCVRRHVHVPTQRERILASVPQWQADLESEDDYLRTQAAEVLAHLRRVYARA